MFAYLRPFLQAQALDKQPLPDYHANLEMQKLYSKVPPQHANGIFKQLMPHVSLSLSLSFTHTLCNQGCACDKSHGS
jgi:hypothetical protein